jgi:hypothetical protein
MSGNDAGFLTRPSGAMRDMFYPYPRYAPRDARRVPWAIETRASGADTGCFTGSNGRQIAQTVLARREMRPSPNWPYCLSRFIVPAVTRRTMCTPRLIGHVACLLGPSCIRTHGTRRAMRVAYRGL